MCGQLVVQVRSNFIVPGVFDCSMRGKQGFQMLWSTIIPKSIKDFALPIIWCPINSYQILSAADWKVTPYYPPAQKICSHQPLDSKRVNLYTHVRTPSTLLEHVGKVNNKIESLLESVKKQQTKLGWISKTQPQQQHVGNSNTAMCYAICNIISISVDFNGSTNSPRDMINSPAFKIYYTSTKRDVSSAPFSLHDVRWCC